MIRPHVIHAITLRNFRSYFAGVLGYLFIVAFCLASAHFAFSAQFFTNNEASLAELTRMFPLLLLFLIPAITMTAWSDEKKLGTDELLFTLPATEQEIVIGKFKSVALVYTVALLFSGINAVVLLRLGNPDIGLLCSTYFGYWLAGLALLSAGMLASSLTGSPTVGFVLGVLFCSLVVFFGDIAYSGLSFFDLLPDSREAVKALSLSKQLEDFSSGVIPIYNVLFFAALTAFMLYLNYVIVSRRRWAGDSVAMGLQFAVRAIAICVIGGSVLAIVAAVSLLRIRFDATAERSFSLSSATKAALRQIDEGDEVVVQAFASKEMPPGYAETRRQLVGLLEEFKAAGGGKFSFREVVVEPFSDEEEEARALGITPNRVAYEAEGGRFEEAEVFLGMEIRSTTDEVVIPFIDKGIPVEYELTRSISTVMQEERRVIGILQTDAKVLPSQTSFMDNAPEWEIVRELRKQFKVVSVSPDKPIKASEERGGKPPKKNFDVLLAVSPSSLTQPQMDNFIDYVGTGDPVLIFDDPLTVSYPFQRRGGITQAPVLPKPTDQSMAMFGQRPPPAPPKAENGELTELQRLLKIQWRNNRVVYDRDNPHSQFASMQPEISFLSRRRSEAKIFADDSPITQDLQEVVTMFAGSIVSVSKPANSKNWPEVTQLLLTGKNSGALRVGSGGRRTADEEPLQAEILLNDDFTAGKKFSLNGKDEDGYKNGGDKGITLGETKELFRNDSRIMFGLADPATMSRFGAERLQIGIDVEWVSKTEFKVNRELPKGMILLVVKDMRIDSVATMGSPNPFNPTPALMMRRDGEISRSDDEYNHCVAVHVKNDNEDNKLNAVFISDIDIIGDQFFQIRSAGNLDVQFDNVTFVLNAIDVLAGEESFIKLRSKRPATRTLAYVESMTSGLRKELAQAEQKAEKDKDDKLEEAQYQLEQQVKEIEQKEGVDDQSKAIMVEQKREQLQRQLDLQTETLERQVQDTKRKASRRVRGEILGIENGVRLLAYGAVAFLPLCFGLLFLGMRNLGEKSTIAPGRRRK